MIKQSNDQMNALFEIVALEMTAPRPFMDYMSGKSIKEIKDKGAKWRSKCDKVIRKVKRMINK